MNYQGILYKITDWTKYSLQNRYVKYKIDILNRYTINLEIENYFNSKLNIIIINFVFLQYKNVKELEYIKIFGT